MEQIEMQIEDEVEDFYRGHGGVYVIVDGQKWPADENGRPLPHRPPHPRAGEKPAARQAKTPAAKPVAPQE